MTPGTRIYTLDGVRGLAAFAVVLSHIGALTYVAGVGLPTRSEFILWHLGAPAVDLFFVLSGYVVAGSLMRRPQLLPYLGRRWLRLAPIAYLAVLLGFLARFAASVASENANFSYVVTDLLRQPLSWQDKLGMLTLVYPYMDVNHFNPPLWTLVVELHMAALMPLFTRLARLYWLFILAIPLGLFAYSYSWPQGKYIPVFFLGTILAVNKWRLPSWSIWPALITGLIILLQRHITGSDDSMVRYYTMPGAALIVLAVIGGVGKRFLEFPAIQWLGQVSYSLYATHFPILLAVTVLIVHLGGGIHLGAVIAIPFCLLMAHVTYLFVEKPIIRLISR